MAGADMVLYRRQNRADHRIEKEMSRKRKHQQMSEVNLELNEDFGMDYEEDIGESEPEVAETNVKKIQNKLLQLVLTGEENILSHRDCFQHLIAPK
ncbi:uncharacterized protein LOC125779334 isoform X2 [Bactrocera dorsalis]|uniref:Uncharacterized protein LOC125779334 isoform X2 n=1 Tax=Bactrocera dorsalis TaxID=27457 RepID=A0ABM3K545_BACDO|nr:uncharacterized protein LOC125779334 isoform X2 [Bactrocera dorsalis]